MCDLSGPFEIFNVRDPRWGLVYLTLAVSMVGTQSSKVSEGPLTLYVGPNFW